MKKSRWQGSAIRRTETLDAGGGSGGSSIVNIGCLMDEAAAGALVTTIPKEIIFLIASGWVDTAEKTDTTYANSRWDPRAVERISYYSSKIFRAFAPPVGDHDSLWIQDGNRFGTNFSSDAMTNLLRVGISSSVIPTYREKRRTQRTFALSPRLIDCLSQWHAARLVPESDPGRTAARSSRGLFSASE